MVKKKIIICGSIGYGGIEKIKDLQEFLKNNDYLIIDHISKKKMNYSEIKDFRDKKELSKKIVTYDLTQIDQADIIIVIAEKPSFGTAVEQYYALKKNKIIVLFSENPVPTPWPIYFSSLIAKSKEELLKILKRMK